LAADYRSMAEQLWALGAANIAWAIPPMPDPYWLPDTTYEDPGRYAVLASTIDAVAGDYGARIRVVDLAGWLEENSLSTDQAARPDGLHWSPEFSAELAERWLGPELLRTALT
jgi:hypothetical protein